MAIQIVQGTAATELTGGVASNTFVFTDNFTVGDYLIIGLFNFVGTAVGVLDNAAVATWTTLGSTTSNSGAWFECVYIGEVTSGGTNTVTVTDPNSSTDPSGGTNNYYMGTGLEISGIDANSISSATVANGPTAAVNPTDTQNIQQGPSMTGGAGQLVYQSVGGQGGIGVVVDSSSLPSSGAWTMLPGGELNGQPDVFGGYAIPTTSGTYQLVVQVVNSGPALSTGIVLVPAGGGGGGGSTSTTGSGAISFSGSGTAQTSGGATTASGSGAISFHGSGTATSGATGSVPQVQVVGRFPTINSGSVAFNLQNAINVSGNDISTGQGSVDVILGSGGTFSTYLYTDPDDAPTYEVVVTSGGVTSSATFTLSSSPSTQQLSSLVSLPQFLTTSSPQATTTGATGPAGVTWRGGYSGSTAYAANDGVVYNGSSFIATASTTGTDPGNPSFPNSPWDLLAEAGTAYTSRVAQASPPTVTVQSGAGTGATATLDALATDVAGVIVLTIGTSPAAGSLVTFAFHTAKSSADYVAILGVIAGAASPGLYLTSAPGTSGWTVASSSAPTASTTYRIPYLVIT